MINKTLFLKSQDVAGEQTSLYALYGWGVNTTNELGDGTTVNKSSPVQIGTATDWQAVSISNLASMTLNNNGLLYAWGRSNSYKFAYVDQNSWSQISIGANHQLAIKSDGSLIAWGANDAGKLGDGTTVTKSAFTKIGSSSWSKVSAGFSHSLAIRSDGALFAWGSNYYGEVGDGTTVNKSSPVQIGTSSWAYIFAGDDCSYAITTDNKLFSWGRNEAGNLGHKYEDPNTWTDLVLTGQASVNEGGFAIRSDGALFTWGQLGALTGLNSTITRSIPIQVGTSSWSAVSTSVFGGGHVLAIRSDGALFAWGNNGFGQLGDGTTVTKSSPVQIGTSSWSKISAGASHTLAITTDGALFAWGTGALGRLGDGTTVNKSSPVQVGTSSWSQVSAGSDISAAIRTDGALFTWGINTLGNLGDGTTVNKSSPVQVGTSSWSQVSASASHALAVRSDGALFAWGDNNSGALGISATGGTRSSPVQVGTDTNWTSIAAGNRVSHALKNDGTLYGWGNGGNYGLGDGTTVNKSSPVQVGTSSWSKITAANITLTGGGGITNGKIYTWGKAAYAHGDVGLGRESFGGVTYVRKSPAPFLAFIPRSSPVQVGTSSWTIVNANYPGAFSGSTSYNASAFGITTDGALFGWGDSLYGYLGLGTYSTTGETFQDTTAPVQIGTSSWTSVVTNYGYTHALTSDGLLFFWGTPGERGGSSKFYAVGDGTTLTRSAPTQVGASSWSKIFTGPTAAVTFVLNGNNELYGWGSQLYRAVGDPSNTTGVSSPVKIGTSSWSLVYSNYGATLGITTSGSLFLWGSANTTSASDNYINALGNTAANTTYASPYQPFSTLDTFSSPVKIGTSSWSMVALGISHTVAIRTDGALFAWGGNASGRLGDGTTTTKSSPVQIGTSSWSRISVGQDYTLAITTDGALFAWGNGALGVLGDGTTVSKSSPVQIGTSSWVYISAGLSHSVAIRTDGALFAWGAGANGRLGDGTTVNKSSPVQVGTSSWAYISAGASHTLAITTDGALFAWGAGTAGMLGDNTTTTKSSPVQIGTSSWSQVHAATTHSVGLTADKRLFVWGNSTHGQLGDGTTVSKSSPVQVGTSSWHMLPTNGTPNLSHVVAIRKG